jgi:putative oxidoreductase
LNDRLERLLENSWTELVGRWILGSMFVVASVHKIADPADFAKIIYGYQLVSKEAINLIAIILPFLELVSGAALLAGIYPKSAALIINLMLLVFSMGISINLLRGHTFDCGCFAMGAESHQSAAGVLLVRDLACLAVGGYVMRYGSPRRWCLWCPIQD